MITGALLPAAQPEGERQYRKDEIGKLPSDAGVGRRNGSFAMRGLFIGNVGDFTTTRPEIVVDELSCYVLVAVKVSEGGG